MKRITSFLITIAMLAAMLPTLAFAENTSAFNDVKTGDYYADAAEALAELDILEGYEDGSFGADRDVTRAEMAAVICRMLDKEADADREQGTTDFEDVPSSHWASGYINYASENKIIQGDGDGKFRPEDNVKYEEAVKMIVCALGLGDDVKATDSTDWSAEYLAIAKTNGITDNAKSVKGSASPRGDIAVMVYDGLTRDLTAPTASKEAGSYSGTQSVELSASAKDAVIYYTTDGTTPTTESTKYEKALSLSKTTSLKAIAVLKDFLVSDVMSVDYTIKGYSGRTVSGGSGGGSSLIGTTYTVSFDLNYDGATGAPESQSVKKGEKATQPDDPERDGYVFMGWHTSGIEINYFDFENTTIAQNQTIYAQWVDANDTTDTDGDGLTNPFERYYGTDETKVDTDGDGLNDYFELNTVDTNPLKTDTDGDGISDNLEDADDDKLTNEDEYNHGTNAIYYDTDHDLLSDYDEIYVYGTDPLKEDTDGDGAKDGDEVAIGSNPLSAETSFVTNADFGEPSEDNPVSISVSAITDANGADTVNIEAVTRSDNYLVNDSIAGYLGYAYDLTTDGTLQNAELTFTYDESLGTIGDDFQPRIYYLNEETGEFEELPNQTVTNGKVTATTTHFSTYILLNKVEFDEVWETEIRTSVIGDDSSDKDHLAFAFVLDSSGSMQSNDKSGLRKKVAKEFVGKMGDNDVAAVIDFDSYANLLTGFVSDKELISTAIDKIDSNGGTNLGKGISLALAQYDGYENTENAYKFIIMLTDGNGGYSTDLTQKAIDSDIIIYTIGLGSDVDESLLKTIAESTNGKYYHADEAEDLIDTFDDIAIETVDMTTDSNNDGISDYYTQLINDGTLCLTNTSYELAGCTDVFGEESADWDGDGLLNGEEIEVVTGSNGLPKIKMISHPFYADYDCDGYNDYVEVKEIGTDPLKYSFPAKTNYDYLADSTSYYAWCISENYNNIWFVKNMINISDWDKTQESEKVLIDYFYDYASEDSVNANAEAIANQAKAETVISGISNIMKIAKNLKSITDSSTGISELDRKQEKVANFKANVFKGLPKIFKCANEKDTETALQLESNILNDIKTGASFVEEFNTTAEGVLSGVEAATTDISGILKIGKDTFNLMYKDGHMVNLPIPKAYTKFAQKYTKWMNADAFAGLNKGQLISIAFNVTDLAADSAELYSTYSKMAANTEAYVEYIEAIDYISENGNNISFVQDAAGNVMSIVLKDGKFMQEWAKMVGVNSVKTFINIGIELLASNPYVATIKAAIDLGISLSGITKTASATVKILMADSISDSFVYLSNSCVTIDNDIWFSVNYYDTAMKYLTQLAQSRIYGEDIAKGEYNISSASHWLADRIRDLKGDMNSDEMIEDINSNISGVYTAAKTIGLTLSPKLPSVSSNSAGNGNHGGGGGAF